MPWKIERRSGKYCVVKEGGGDVEGCHASKSAAQKQLRALYAGEGKNMSELQEKSMDGWWFGALMQAAWDFFSSTLDKKEPNDVDDEVEAMPDEISDKAKSRKNGIMLYKNASGGYSWVTVYSNSFRDDDNPREIISAESHKSFVKKVENGEVPYPDLWFYHDESVNLGKATWVAIDDVSDSIVFALAGGDVHDHAVPVVKALQASQAPLGVSHGMPLHTIERDLVDSTIITQHQTVEISVLPLNKAANPYTSFVVLGDAGDEHHKHTEDNRMISQEAKTALTSLGVPEDALEALEQHNASASDKALGEGRQHKSATPAADESESVVEEADEKAVEAVSNDNEVADDEVTEAVMEDTTPKDPDASYVTVDALEDFAKNLANELRGALSPVTDGMTQLGERLNTLESELKSIQKSDEKKIAEKAVETPTASLAKMIALSVIGSDDTRVDGRTSLGKAKPAETDFTESGSMAVNAVRSILGE